MKGLRIILQVIPCVIAASCNSNAGITGVREPDAPEVNASYTESRVDSADGSIAFIASPRTVSKGKIESVTNIAVYSQVQEQIVKLNIKDGYRVKKGDVIIVLDDERLMNQLVQARNNFEQAQFLFEEILVGQGYKKDELDQVPEYVQTMAKVKSGYNISEASLRQAERNYARREITAPVSGTVTDLAVHQYDLPQSTTPLCRLFDSGHLKVVFNILENERSRIEVGNKVTVTTVAYVNENHIATVTLISPKVDENGMIKIEAEILDSHNLMPGMTAFVDL